MTMFQNFTGTFRKQDITLFSDFVANLSPFGAAVSTAIGTSAATAGQVSNSNADEHGKITFGTTSATSAGVFGFSGIYMAQTEASAGAGVTRDYRLGNGEIDVSARVLKTSGTLNHLLIVGLANASYDAVNRPAEHFAGWHARSDAGVWSIGVNNGTSSISMETTVPTESYAELRVVVSPDAKFASFYGNGTLVKTLVFDLSKTAAVLPCVEMKDKVSGGSGVAGTVKVDWFMVTQQVRR